MLCIPPNNFYTLSYGNIDSLNIEHTQVHTNSPDNRKRFSLKIQSVVGTQFSRKCFIIANRDNSYRHITRCSICAVITHSLTFFELFFCYQCCREREYKLEIFPLMKVCIFFTQRVYSIESNSYTNCVTSSILKFHCSCGISYVRIAQRKAILLTNLYRCLKELYLFLRVCIFLTICICKV